MDNTNEKIASMIKKMSFERKKPVSIEAKQSTKQILCSVKEAKDKLDKLHLKLWYAVEKNDYHSVNLAEAKQELSSIIKVLESQV